MALLTNRDKEERPWGSFERFTKGEPATIKLVRIAPGKRFSLQFHNHRSEFWRIINGDGVVTLDGKQFPASIGDEFEIPVGMKHRMEAGAEGIHFLEIALGDFDEGDIVRVEDDFGRAESAT